MFYILKHKTRADCFVGIYTSSNEGSDFCNSTTVEFDFGMDVPYLFTSLYFVTNVFTGEHHCGWYNSSTCSPSLSSYVSNEIIKNYEIIKLVPEM